MLLRTLVFIGALLGAAASPALASDTQVFQLPNGAFPHDVAPAPDGKVWYSAQRNGALCILDPVTGQSREVKLGPNSAPHGVIQGPDGAAWLTDGGQNAIARVDPKSEEVKVWKLPANSGHANRTPARSTATAPIGSPGRAASTAGSTRGRLRSRSGKRRAGQAPTGSPLRPRATSTTPRSPAITSPGSTRRAAPRP